MWAASGPFNKDLWLGMLAELTGQRGEERKHLLLFEWVPDPVPKT